MSRNPNTPLADLYAHWASYDNGRYQREREAMVARQIAARGVKDERVLDVLRHLPRHHFVPPSRAAHAYEDRPQDIGTGQTISQPYMVAWMTELLHVEPHHRVLDVGTGSGYQAALLAALAGTVYSVELHAGLLEYAETRFSDLGLTNVETCLCDGSEGWFEHAPYDRILVAAGAPEVPDILQKQLTDGGRLVIPVGSRDMQSLVTVDRDGGRFIQSSHGECIFVPLLGSKGWSS